MLGVCGSSVEVGRGAAVTQHGWVRFSSFWVGWFLQAENRLTFHNMHVVLVALFISTKSKLQGSSEGGDMFSFLSQDVQLFGF